MLGIDRKPSKTVCAQRKNPWQNERYSILKYYCASKIRKLVAKSHWAINMILILLLDVGCYGCK